MFSILNTVASGVAMADWGAAGKPGSGLRVEEIYRQKVKENERVGGGSGASGRQKSDNPIDTKKEIAKIANVGRPSKSLPKSATISNIDTREEVWEGRGLANL